MLVLFVQRTAVSWKMSRSKSVQIVFMHFAAKLLLVEITAIRHTIHRIHKFSRLKVVNYYSLRNGNQYKLTAFVRQSNAASDGITIAINGDLSGFYDLSRRICERTWVDSRHSIEVATAEASPSLWRWPMDAASRVSIISRLDGILTVSTGSRKR